jgi:hypothetical protein
MANVDSNPEVRRISSLSTVSSGSNASDIEAGGRHRVRATSISSQRASVYETGNDEERRPRVPAKLFKGRHIQMMASGMMANFNRL